MEYLIPLTIAIVAVVVVALWLHDESDKRSYTPYTAKILRKYGGIVWLGKVDKIRVHDHATSSAEIAEIAKERGVYPV